MDIIFNKYINENETCKYINLNDYILNKIKIINNTINVFFLSSGIDCFLELNFIKFILNNKQYDEVNIFLFDIVYNKYNKKKIIDKFNDILNVYNIKKYNIILKNNNFKFLYYFMTYTNKISISFGYQNIFINNNMQLNSFLNYYFKNENNLTKNVYISIKNNCLKLFIKCLFNMYKNMIDIKLFKKYFYNYFNHNFLFDILQKSNFIFASCIGVYNNDALIPCFKSYL